MQICFFIIQYEGVTLNSFNRFSMDALAYSIASFPVIIIKLVKINYLPSGQ